MPPTSTRPAVGRSIPPSRLTRVVLPAPERPVTAANTPRRTSRSTPRRTCSVASPLRKSRTRPPARTTRSSLSLPDGVDRTVGSATAAVLPGGRPIVVPLRGSRRDARRSRRHAGSVPGSGSGSPMVPGRAPAPDAGAATRAGAAPPGTGGPADWRTGARSGQMPMWSPSRRSRTRRWSPSASTWARGSCSRPAPSSTANSSSTNPADPSPARRSVSVLVRPSRIATVRPTCSATSGSWVTRTMVVPSSRFTRRRASKRRLALSVSSSPVGSSARSAAGRFASATATATRCCSPPDSRSGRAVRSLPTPTRSSRAAARRPRSCPGAPSSSIGSSTFSTADR